MTIVHTGHAFHFGYAARNLGDRDANKRQIIRIARRCTRSGEPNSPARQNVNMGEDTGAFPSAYLAGNPRAGDYGRGT
jgi:hypothetical protein